MFGKMLRTAATITISTASMKATTMTMSNCVSINDSNGKAIPQYMTFTIMCKSNATWNATMTTLLTLTTPTMKAMMMTTTTMTTTSITATTTMTAMMSVDNTNNDGHDDNKNNSNNFSNRSCIYFSHPSQVQEQQQQQRQHLVQRLKKFIGCTKSGDDFESLSFFRATK